MFVSMNIGQLMSSTSSRKLGVRSRYELAAQLLSACLLNITDLRDSSAYARTYRQAGSSENCLGAWMPTRPGLASPPAP
jgi:hypothetical protein